MPQQRSTTHTHSAEKPHPTTHEARREPAGRNPTPESRDHLHRGPALHADGSHAHHPEPGVITPHHTPVTHIDIKRSPSYLRLLHITPVHYYGRLKDMLKRTPNFKNTLSVKTKLTPKTIKAEPVAKAHLEQKTTQQRSFHARLMALFPGNKPKISPFDED